MNILEFALAGFIQSRSQHAIRPRCHRSIQGEKQMTDRELLELAAKAAGIPIWTDIDGTVFTDDPNGIEFEWNPLTDDGDALRLAVKLKIDVAHTNIHSPQVHALADAKIQVWEDSSTDPYAATRRAIVRAAAEIGKEMT